MKAYQKFLDEMKQEHAESYQIKLLEYASLTPSEEAVVEEVVEQLADDEIPDDEDN